jgi:hypothetical protein
VPGGTPLILTESYTPIPDDPLTRCAVRRFSSQLAELIKLLVKYGMASTEPLGIGGSERKVRVRVNFVWWDLVAALQGSAPARWQTLSLRLAIAFNIPRSSASDSAADGLPPYVLVGSCKFGTVPVAPTNSTTRGAWSA